MTPRDVHNLLQQAKETPEFGGDFARVEERAFSRVLSSIGKTDVQATPFGLREYVQYALRDSVHLFVRPFMVGVAGVSFLFGGWIASVHASMDSLPGDVLYSVKLATERVQIQLSGSQRRAKLHTEFASRRLQEVTDLSVSDRPDKAVQVKVAVQKFQEEVKQARTELATARAENSVEATAIATVIDQKNTQLKNLLEQSQDIVPADSQEEVAKAQEEVRQSEEQVLDTLVESHEVSQEAHTADTLQQKFQITYRALVQRSALNRGRLEVLSQKATDVAEATGLSETEVLANLQTLRARNSSFEPDLSEAQNLLAAGGYRASFAKLQSIDDVLKDTENHLAEMEIALTTMGAPPTASAESTAEVSTF